MAVEAIGTLITQVGIPGAMLVALLIMCENWRKDMKELNEHHKEEMMEISKAVDNNTNILGRLLEHLKGGETLD